MQHGGGDKLPIQRPSVMVMTPSILRGVGRKHEH